MSLPAGDERAASSCWSCTGKTCKNSPWPAAAASGCAAAAVAAAAANDDNIVANRDRTPLQKLVAVNYCCWCKMTETPMPLVVVVAAAAAAVVVTVISAH